MPWFSIIVYFKHNQTYVFDNATKSCQYFLKVLLLHNENLKLFYSSARNLQNPWYSQIYSGVQQFTFLQSKLEIRLHLLGRSCGSQGILQDQNDWVSSQKHLWDKSVLVDWLGLLLSYDPKNYFNLLVLSLCNLPFPVLGSSVHISLTPSRTMLQCLSNAFTLPSNFLLFL